MTKEPQSPLSVVCVCEPQRFVGLFCSNSLFIFYRSSIPCLYSKSLVFIIQKSWNMFFFVVFFVVFFFRSCARALWKCLCFLSVIPRQSGKSRTAFRLLTCLFCPDWLKSWLQLLQEELLRPCWWGKGGGGGLYSGGGV